MDRPTGFSEKVVGFNNTATGFNDKATGSNNKVSGSNEKASGYYRDPCVRLRGQRGQATDLITCRESLSPM